MLTALRQLFLERTSQAMNGDGGRLQGLMSVRGVVENDLKWVMTTSGYVNESRGDENGKKNHAFKKTKILDHKYHVFPLLIFIKSLF